MAEGNKIPSRSSKSIVLMLSVLLLSYGISGVTFVEADLPVSPPSPPPVSPPSPPPVSPPSPPPVSPPSPPPVDPPTAPPVDPPTAPPVDPPTAPPVDPPTAPPVDPPGKGEPPTSDDLPKGYESDQVKKVPLIEEVIASSTDKKLEIDKENAVNKFEQKIKQTEKQLHETKKITLSLDLDPLEKHKIIQDLEKQFLVEVKKLEKELEDFEKRNLVLQSEISNKLETKVDKKITRLVNSIDPATEAKNLGFEFNDGKTTLVIELSSIDQNTLNKLKKIGTIEVQTGNFIQITVDLSKIEMIKGISSVKNTRAPTYISMTAGSQADGIVSPYTETSIIKQINFEDESMSRLKTQIEDNYKTFTLDSQKTSIERNSNGTSPLTKKLFELIDTVSEKNLRVFVDLLAKYGNVIQLRADLGEKEIKSISNFDGLLEFPQSEGVYTISADVIHEKGITGNGVKVAVLDLSFDTSNPKIAENIKEYQSFRKGVQGNMVQQISDIAKIQAHGTAVAEVIIDVAPAVELYLYEMDTDVEFVAAVDKAIANKVDVIAMAAGWPNLPTDGTSHITKKVEEATSNGISFVVPSGNFAKKHWEGNFSDSNLNGWHEFVTDDEGLGIVVSESQVKNQVPIIVYMTWETGVKDIADFDLGLLDPSGTIAEYSSTTQKNKDSIFSEYIYFVPQVAGTYLIGISYAGEAKSLADIPSYAKLELFSINNEIEHAIVPSSVVVPSDAKGVTSVGAINHMTGIIEPFSSQGPTNHAKQAPFIVGPDGITTLAYNGQLFFGTSATTPYIAGVTALLIQMNPEASPEQIQEILKKNAELNGSLTSKNNVNSLGFGSVNLALLSSS